MKKWKYLFGPKTRFHWKKWFSWRLGQFFRCFEWKYRAVSENVFSMSVIYLHFSHCKFSFFWWIDWVRFKTRLAKDPILELADWTGLVCKFSEFDLKVQAIQKIPRKVLLPTNILSLTNCRIFLTLIYPAASLAGYFSIQNFQALILARILIQQE